MNINYDTESVINKMKNWAAYQERSQHEARVKLYSLRVSEEDIEHIITELITNNFLSEERFALTLTSGKFRIKHWGKNKIKVELRKHKISDYLINKALNSIDPEEYEMVIKKIIDKRLSSGNDISDQKQFYSTLNYLVSRGFEADLVLTHLKIINKNVEL